MKSLRKFGFALVGITIAVGLKFYNKSATAKDVKQDMLSVCSTDSGCQQAVNTHFQQCFDRSYSMGSRRRSSSLDSQKLSACINQNSGIAYFGI